MVFDARSFADHEQVTYLHDEETGLRGIVAVHDTTLGPSLGGTRMRTYENQQVAGEDVTPETAALDDVLRLSEAMTYKAAAADLDLGGGKAVLVGDPKTKDEALMRAYGRAVDRLGGQYITSVDVNTSVDDMDVISSETEYVTGTSAGLGDPSPITAHGVLHGMRACVEHVTGRDTLSDIHVAVQGLGKVGSRLTEELLERGATVTVTDVNDGKVEAIVEDSDATGVAPDDIYDVECDVFAPCAFGGALDDETIPRLECAIVAGAANNVLADEDRHAQDLHERGILYGPDYVLNAGGLITVEREYFGGTREEAFHAATEIEARVHEMIESAEDADVPVLEGARRYVMDRLESEGRTAVSAGVV